MVSLATGTKCLDWDSAGDRAGTLSDCHAEVISRRALLRFLYSQLELLLWYEAPLPQCYHTLLQLVFHLWTPSSLKSTSRRAGRIHLHARAGRRLQTARRRSLPHVRQLVAVRGRSAQLPVREQGSM